MITVLYSTTGKARLSTDAPPLPHIAPDDVQQLYADWCEAEDKWHFVSSISGIQACALVDHLTALAKAQRE